MKPLFGLLGAVWIALGIVAHNMPTIAGTLIGAGVGATVSIALYAATRAQARRQTTLDLFKEDYSADFAIQRRACERFMARHEGVNRSLSTLANLGPLPTSFYPSAGFYEDCGGAEAIQIPDRIPPASSLPKPFRPSIERPRTLRAPIGRHTEDSDRRSPVRAAQSG